MPSYSLTKKGNSPYYFVRFRTAHPEIPGKFVQHTKSTRATNKKEADIKAAAIIQAAESEAGAGDKKSREIYTLVQEAADMAANGTLNEINARNLISQIYGISTGEKLETYTVREWCVRFMTQKEAEIKAGTIENYQKALIPFLDWLGERADNPLSTLTRDTVEDFRTHLLGHLSPSTCNVRMSKLSTCFRAAVPSKIPTNPAANLTNAKLPTGQEKLPFTEDEVRMILAAANDRWTGMVLMAVYAGTSMIDAAKMTWEQVDLAGQRITYRRTKKGKDGEPIWIPMHDRLAEWFMERAGDHGGPVFGAFRDKVVNRNVVPSVQFNKLVDRAGVDVPYYTAPDGRKVRRKTFHSLRHLANSAMANAGVAPDIRMELMGHSSAASNKTYTHLKWETLADAVSKLPSLDEEEEGK